LISHSVIRGLFLGLALWAPGPRGLDDRSMS